MDFATDPRSGQVISADEADRRRRTGRRYLCPRCKKPVHLRSGNVISPYFAHDKGVASTDCENYHPGGEYAGDSEGTRSPAPRLQPLAIYIVPDGRIGSNQDWHLEILVPRSIDSSGTVYIPAGRAGETRVACARLEDHGQRYPIRLTAEPYRLRFSGNIDPDYARRLSVATPGFSPDVVAAFRYSESGGRRLDDNRPLYWGRGYYLLWHGSRQMQWPPGVWREPLRSVGSWSAARVELPSDENDVVAAWADRFLDREVVPPPVVLSLVHPAAALRREDDTLVVPSTDAIIVGLSGERGSATPETLYISNESGSDSSSLTLPGRLPILIEITNVPLGVTRFSLDDSDDIELVLEIATELPAALIQTPSVIVSSRSGERRVPIFTDESERVLAEVRSGVGPLLGLDLDPLKAAWFRVRSKESHVWHDYAFAPDPETLGARPKEARREFQARVFAALRDALARDDEFELDLGSYGRLVSAPARAAEQPMPRIELRAVLRSRLRWLLGSLDRARTLTMVADDRRLAQMATALLAHDVANRQDQELLMHVQLVTQWPRMLLPHANDLATQLRNIHTIEP